ncbi:hypothetical protein ACFL6Y_02295 [Elusimicrobiota bacterium]
MRENWLVLAACIVLAASALHAQQAQEPACQKYIWSHPYNVIFHDVQSDAGSFQDSIDPELEDLAKRAKLKVLATEAQAVVQALPGLRLEVGVMRNEPHDPQACTLYFFRKDSITAAQRAMDRRDLPGVIMTEFQSLTAHLWNVIRNARGRFNRAKGTYEDIGSQFKESLREDRIIEEPRVLQKRFDQLPPNLLNRKGMRLACAYARSFSRQRDCVDESAEHAQECWENEIYLIDKIKNSLGF